MTFSLHAQRFHLLATAACRRCGGPYPRKGFPHRCPDCDGVFGLVPRASTASPGTVPIFSLGEGKTPLLPLKGRGEEVFVKCEHYNPTGSYKDRGTARLVGELVRQAVRAAVEDSSGNAGASFAAYAARAGIAARIYVPESASGPKLAQIERVGAELVRVPGPRQKATDAVYEALEQGGVYASHAYQPHWLAGVAGMALEIVEELGQPGSVVVPVGQGGLLVSLYAGFRALLQHGLIASLPVLMGMQAERCAPLWYRQTGRPQPDTWGSSLAEGICVSAPARGDEVLEALEGSGGQINVVREDAIRAGVDALASQGLDVEPTSGVVYAALELLPSLPRPTVLVLTGHGLKTRS